ncbi:MAG: DUF362 domain-containing protein [Bacteroidetes bacterium]|nr:DUF362 domain-containing protein [Bacteroidota bacterium]
MVCRRSFLKTLVAGGAALAIRPHELLAGRQSTAATYFGVHAFIESHPDAVFIMRTSVDAKTNSAAVLEAGLTFGSSVFVPMTVPGTPVSHRVAIKPNIVMMPLVGEKYMGIVTDPHFVEGVIQSLKLLGLQGTQFYLREVNSPAQFTNSGYAQMAARTGADLRDLSDPVGVLAESDLQWIDVPDGRWFKKIPYLWPVNAPDTWLLNISKLKTHLMGLSLCAKNLQGAIPSPYVVHCAKYGEAWNLDPAHVREDANARIWDDYQRHLAAGIPRWDRPGAEGGIWQEVWAARCADNNSVTHPALHIIEGIYGREGPFVEGPGDDGQGIDHLTNMIIFGKNAFHVDNIGIWLGGHEPGNFGLLHIAVERGLASILNPHEIPLYDWFPDGTCVATPVESFTRASLRTQYLCRDYGGQAEPSWHLVNEPYAYAPVLQRQLAVNAGWNIVSVPVLAANRAATALFPGASSDAFEFENGYSSAATLDMGKGYWLKFNGSGFCSVTGSQATHRTIPVRQGWNLIAPLESVVATDDIISNPSGIIASGFFGYNDGSNAVETLEVGRGYWVEVDADGVLILPAGSPKRGIPDARIERPATRILLRDASGHQAVLLLGHETNAPSKGKLPPLPPRGVFDVRFSDDRFIHGPAPSHQLCLHSAAYPVTVTVENPGKRMLRLKDSFGAELVDAVLAPTAPVTIERDFGVLRIEESAAPLRFELCQNTPNPFNPTTVISYTLAERATVTIDVYDLLGRALRSLVNETKEAGTYRVTLNVDGLASGMYVYRMVAGKFHDAKTMVVLK